MAEFRFEAVTKTFGPTTAVAGLSLAAFEGEFIVLLGPSGAGKTTTLRLLAGLERADAGRIHIGGVDVTGESPATRDVTFVFQQYSLYPHLSVYDNLAFPLRAPARRWPPGRIETKVREVARLLHIEEKLADRAAQLSGGQMQRVAIGRALVRQPRVMLMDEPLSSLDAKLRSELRVELKRIQRELHASVLYVTHDQTEAMTLATRIGVLEHGRLVQFGSPREVYEQPASTYVATRLGSPGINLVARALLPHLPAPAAAATIGARTEHVRVRRAPAGAALGRVRWIEHLGDANHLHLRLGSATAGETDFVTLTDPATPLAVGDPVHIDFVAPLFFDAHGERVTR
ncbi:MAG TPA: ABC transporter ATP-binding protein [Burkholderiaceae bacterium]|nr:ABC transporter ATP-binding protein [Burkholderiaceae bacterium]